MGELIVNGLKLTFFLAISLAFMTAINSLLDLITSILFGNIIGEVLGVLSACLPFNALSVFSAIGASCSAILSFLIAQKIYNLSLASPLGD